MTDKKEEVKETVTFTNAMLERFANDKTIMKLMEADLSTKIKFPLYQFSMTVLKSPAMEAYSKRKNEIVKAYNEEKAAERKAQMEKDGVEADNRPVGEPSMPIDHHEILELFALETDLTLNKLKLKVTDKLPLNTSDMIQLSWIIDFVE